MDGMGEGGLALGDEREFISSTHEFRPLFLLGVASIKPAPAVKSWSGIRKILLPLCVLCTPPPSRQTWIVCCVALGFTTGVHGTHNVG